MSSKISDMSNLFQIITFLLVIASLFIQKTHEIIPAFIPIVNFDFIIKFTSNDVVMFVLLGYVSYGLFTSTLQSTKYMTFRLGSNQYSHNINIDSVRTNDGETICVIIDDNPHYPDFRRFLSDLGFLWEIKIQYPYGTNLAYDRFNRYYKKISQVKHEMVLHGDINLMGIRRFRLDFELDEERSDRFDGGEPIRIKLYMHHNNMIINSIICKSLGSLSHCKINT